MAEKNERKKRHYISPDIKAVFFDHSEKATLGGGACDMGSAGPLSESVCLGCGSDCQGAGSLSG